jgi:hypothetical protein
MPNLVVNFTTWPLYAPPPREDPHPHHRYLLTTSLGGPQNLSEGFAEEKIPCPCWDSNPNSFVVQPEHVWTLRFVFCRFHHCLPSSGSQWKLKVQAFFARRTNTCAAQGHPCRSERVPAWSTALPPVFPVCTARRDKVPTGAKCLWVTSRPGVSLPDYIY